MEDRNKRLTQLKKLLTKLKEKDNIIIAMIHNYSKNLSTHIQKADTFLMCHSTVSMSMGIFLFGGQL